MVFFSFQDFAHIFQYFYFSLSIWLKKSKFRASKILLAALEIYSKKIIISSYCLNKSLSRNLAYSMDENVNNYSLDFSCKGIRNELYHFLISILIQNFEIHKFIIFLLIQIFLVTCTMV